MTFLHQVGIEHDNDDDDTIENIFDILGDQFRRR